MDSSSVKMVLQVKKDFNPDVTIFGGDLFDMRCLLKGGSNNDKEHDPKRDFEIGTNFLEELKPDVFIWGNHDKRISKLEGAKGDAIRREAGRKFNEELNRLFKLIGVRQVLYKSREYYKIGNTKFLHGIYFGQNACAQHINMCLSNCVFGHTHSISQFSTPNQDGCTAYNTGCLCNIDMEWDDDKPQCLRHENGFAYGVLSQNDCYLIQARKVNGIWICPTI